MSVMPDRDIPRGSQAAEREHRWRPYTTYGPPWLHCAACHAIYPWRMGVGLPAPFACKPELAKYITCSDRADNADRIASR